MRFVLALFFHRELPSLRTHWLLFARHSPLATRYSPLPPDSLATDHWPLFSRHSPLRPLVASRKLGSFACPIPPWFVLSCELPMTNTRANWLRFGAFLSPRAPPLTSLTTGHYPLAPRPTPHAPR